MCFKKKLFIRVIYHVREKIYWRLVSVAASMYSSSRVQLSARLGHSAAYSACIRWGRFVRVCCLSKLLVCCEECWSAVNYITVSLLHAFVL